MHGSGARAAQTKAGNPRAADDKTELTSVDALLDAVVAEALVAEVAHVTA